ncbi:Protein kinase domain-containing protein [Aphelenchoides besseyi]|nr:Protein kinase domain-containing protein [Aphelenchoides besseyi]
MFYIAARNCLLCLKYGIVKISDFGLSSVGNVQTLDRKKPAPIRYLAPEVLKTQQFGKPADIWALGLVYWEVFTNAAEMPFKEYTLLEVQQKLTTEAEFHPQMPDDCLPDIKKLALKCWAMDPALRPTADICNANLTPYANPKRQAPQQVALTIGLVSWRFRELERSWRLV